MADFNMHIKLRLSTKIINLNTNSSAVNPFSSGDFLTSLALLPCDLEQQTKLTPPPPLNGNK
jgi:hypothetical protein